MDSTTQPFALPVPPPNSAVRAGWICFAVFACTFWVPLVGGLCFIATIVLAIVALATNQVRSGLILFFTAASSGILLGLAVLMFGVGMLGLAAKSVQQGMERKQREVARAQRHQLADLPPPVNVYPPRPVLPSSAPTPIHTTPVVAPGQSVDAAADFFVQQARLTSVVGGEPPIVVINGKGYKLGQEVVTPSGTRLRVNAVTAETVTLRGRTRDYQLRLK